MKTWAAAVIVPLMAYSLGSATPTAASCAGSVPNSEVSASPSANLVFVGTVIGTSDQERTATVHVDEVWTGRRIPSEVIMRGSPDVRAAATSVDRHYQVGHRYLFAPASVDGPPFDDNACTATREFSAAAAATRPNAVIQYPPLRPAVPLVPLLAVAAAGIGAAIYAVVRRRRRRGTAANT